MWSRLRSLVKGLLGRGRLEAHMTEEMLFHLEQYTEDLIAGGLSRGEAARRARLEFGSVDGTKEDCREARGLRLFDELHQDLRRALRSMRKAPAFTATALATLALCIGSNLAIFAVVDGVLLRPLPFPHADRLVRVFNTYPKAGVPDDGCSITNYYERRNAIAAFSSVAAYREGAGIVGEPGSTERELVMQVSPDFFATLGVAPALGRSFTDEETTYDTADVAIVSDAYWRQRLQAAPDALGRSIRVDGFAKRIVGVLPPEFRFLSSRARIFLPWASNPEQRVAARRHWGSSSQMIARLAEGATAAEGESQVNAQNAALERDNPEGNQILAAGFRTMAVPLHADHVASIRPALWLVQAGALFLLLIGVVNLANLLLIRASAGAKEQAVRRAIGASRGRLVKAALTETLLLTLIGGVLGVAVGVGGLRLLTVLGADRLPLGAHVALDTRVLALAVLGSVGLGLALALPVAWQALGNGPTNALQSECRGATSTRATQRLRHAFLVAQIALAFVLLSGAGLLSLSLGKVLALPSGFRPQEVLSGHVSLPWRSYPDPVARLAFVERTLGEIGGLPGIQSAGILTNVPFSGNSNKSAATVEGYTLPPGESLHGIYSYGVAGDAFAALGFTLIKGRFLTSDDSRRTDRACVVDRDFAQRYWPNGGAIGQRLFFGGARGRDDEAFTVVGVVGAVKQAALTDTEPQGAVYYPYRYWPGDNGLFVVARGVLAPSSLGNMLRQVVRKTDPEVPITDVQPMEARITDSLVARRSPAVLAVVFSAMAALLTAIGTYGVLAYAVAQRRREIGLRMALGAGPGQVRAQFLALALRLLAAGSALGLMGAVAVGRGLQSVLFGVPAVHPVLLGGTAVVMSLVSVAACLLPSLRASRISPVEALAEA
jgi:putative ABC transport system permease protein